MSTRLENALGLLAWDFPGWDNELLQRKVARIAEWTPASDEAARPLLQAALQQADAAFVYTRVGAKQLAQQKALIETGFFLSRTVLKIGLKKPAVPAAPRKLLAVHPLEPSQHASLREISLAMFDYSRFHEDLFIPKALADARIVRFAGHLADSGMPAFVLKHGEAVSAYMFHEPDDRGSVNLVLGGCENGKGMYFPMFLSTLVHTLWLQGAPSIHTEISCANTVVVNSYLACGFTVQGVSYDYHWHRA